MSEIGAPPPAPVRRNPARKGVGVFLPPLPRGDRNVPPPIRPTPAPPEPSESNRGEEGTRMSPLRVPRVFLRSSPTGPGPAKSCEKRSGGFPTPTPTGGQECPPSYPPNSGPTGAQRKQPRRRGDKNVPPPGAPCFSQELPHRPWSGEILREKEWGFSYPHSHGGTKSPPSYSRNSGPAGAQRRQPQRRGGQECPPSVCPMFSQKRGFVTPDSGSLTKRGTGMSPLTEYVRLFFQEC